MLSNPESTEQSKQPELPNIANIVEVAGDPFDNGYVLEIIYSTTPERHAAKQHDKMTFIAPRSMIEKLALSFAAATEAWRRRDANAGKTADAGN